MPITVAPTSASARANCRWLDGKNGSTKTTFMPGMLASGRSWPRADGDSGRGYSPHGGRRVRRAVSCSKRRRASWRRRRGCPTCGLALITCEPEDRLPPELRQHLAAHWRIDDPLDPGQIAAAVQGLSRQLGPVERLLAVLEQLQVPLAQVREHLGIDGMDAGHRANNFRDKAQMKTVLRAAGVPCARHRLAVSAADALEFRRTRSASPSSSSRLPGPGRRAPSGSTTPTTCSAWLDTVPPTPDRPALMEEFLTGDEGSYDSVMVDGQVVWDSVSNYLPTAARGAAQPVDAVGGAAAARHRRSRVRRHPGGRAAGAAGARAARPGSPTWSGSAARTARSPCPRSAPGRPAPRSPRCSATRTTSTCTPPGPGSWWTAASTRPSGGGPRARSTCAGRAPGRSGRCTAWTRCRPGWPPWSSSRGCREPGQPSSGSYEGDGYVIVRHPDTEVVTAALRQIVSTVRVELG